MKYTVDGKTYNIDDKFINKTRRAYGVSVKEAIMMYLSDEGILVDPQVEALTAKAKVNGAGASAGKGRRKVSRKPDETKRSLISALNEFINSLDNTDNVSVVNVERIISFSIGNDTYELTLSKKRKPKA